MCGFGGLFTEVLADRVFAAAPINRVEALALIERLKTQKLLNGFRGVRGCRPGCAGRYTGANRRTGAHVPADKGNRPKSVDCQ